MSTVPHVKAASTENYTGEYPFLSFKYFAYTALNELTAALSTDSAIAKYL